MAILVGPQESSSSCWPVFVVVVVVIVIVVVVVTASQASVVADPPRLPTGSAFHLLDEHNNSEPFGGTTGGSGPATRNRFELELELAGRSRRGTQTDANELFVLLVPGGATTRSHLDR